MAMMGSAPTGSGSELSFTDVIGMLKDEPSYQTKLREIGNRLNETKAAEKHIAEVNADVEKTRRLTADMAAKAEKQLVEARQLKEEADRQVAKAVQHERDLVAQHDTFQKQAEAELEGHREHLRNAFIAREKEVAAKEQALLAKIKDFQGMQADEKAERAAFEASRKSKEAEFARTEAERKEELALIAKAKGEAEQMKQDLKTKLDAIKAISAK